MWAAEVKLKKSILFPQGTLERGLIVTITKGLNCKYALWVGHGIYDLKAKYVDQKTLKILSQD
jgi:hypothetical protein